MQKKMDAPALAESTLLRALDAIVCKIDGPNFNRWLRERSVSRRDLAAAFDAYLADIGLAAEYGAAVLAIDAAVEASRTELASVVQLRRVK